ncbi:MAG: hypothetical protein HQM10_07340 [Candidatus Riflebacteria bacterium]|nr:hypothetical protein [Candidatus Riflebacteria bacterium]
MKLRSRILKLIFVFSYCLLCCPLLFAGEVKFEIVKLLKVLGYKYVKGEENWQDKIEIGVGDSERYLTEKFQYSSRDEVEKLFREWSGGELTKEQKKTLEVIDCVKGEMIKSLMALGKKNLGKDDCDIVVKIFDTSLVENERGKDKVLKEFWPCFSRNTSSITIPTAYFATKKYPGTVLVHELAHSVDKAVHEDNAYGPDGSHSVNEITKPIAAFKEGWAIYNAYDAFPGDYGIPFNLKEDGVKIESADKGKYDNYAGEKVTGKEILCVEGVNAKIMQQIASEYGREKLEKAFLECNSKGTTIKNLFSSFVKLNPDSTKKVFEILDKETLGILKDSEITEILGDGKTVKSLLSARKQSPLSREASDRIQSFIEDYQKTLKNLMAQPQPLSEEDAKMLQKYKRLIAGEIDRFKSSIAEIQKITRNKKAMAEFSPARQAELKADANSFKEISKKQNEFMETFEKFMKVSDNNNQMIKNNGVDDSNINTTQPEAQEQPAEGTSEKGLFGN